MSKAMSWLWKVVREVVRFLLRKYLAPAGTDVVDNAADDAAAED